MSLPDPRVKGKPFFRTVKVYAVQMKEEFQVETPYGFVAGKSGDYLVRTESGELWRMEKEAFEKHHRGHKVWRAPEIDRTGSTIEIFEMLNLIKGMTAMSRVHQVVRMATAKESKS